MTTFEAVAKRAEDYKNMSIDERHEFHHNVLALLETGAITDSEVQWVYGTLIQPIVRWEEENLPAYAELRRRLHAEG